jgi:chemotaxis protein histidine kinase CheA
MVVYCCKNPDCWGMSREKDALCSDCESEFGTMHVEEKEEEEEEDEEDSRQMRVDKMLLMNFAGHLGCVWAIDGAWRLYSGLLRGGKLTKVTNQDRKRALLAACLHRRMEEVYTSSQVSVDVVTKGLKVDAKTVLEFLGKLYDRRSDEAVAAVGAANRASAASAAAERAARVAREASAAKPTDAAAVAAAAAARVAAAATAAVAAAARARAAPATTGTQSIGFSRCQIESRMVVDRVSALAAEAADGWGGDAAFVERLRRVSLDQMAKINARMKDTRKQPETLARDLVHAVARSLGCHGRSSGVGMKRPRH